MRAAQQERDTKSCSYMELDVSDHTVLKVMHALNDTHE
jgi:hypothetical protein